MVKCGAPFGRMETDTPGFCEVSSNPYWEYKKINEFKFHKVSPAKNAYAC